MCVICSAVADKGLLSNCLGNPALLPCVYRCMCLSVDSAQFQYPSRLSSVDSQSRAFLITCKQNLGRESQIKGPLAKAARTMGKGRMHYVSCMKPQAAR